MARDTAQYIRPGVGNFQLGDFEFDKTTSKFHVNATMDLGTRVASTARSISTGGSETGLNVGVVYDVDGVANTTDYIGSAAIFNYIHNLECKSGGTSSPGMATIWANVEIDEQLYGSGGMSAGWFTIWADATGDAAHVRSSAGARAYHLQAIDCAIVTGAAFDLGANCDLFGVRIDSSVHASATMSGLFYGINIGKSSGKLNWTTGIDINNSTTGIDIGACTDAINITGTCAGHALDTGAYGDVVIGNRTAGSGLSISTGGFSQGLLVAVEYDAAGVANTTDYIGAAAIFNYNHNLTCTSGGDGTSGMATIAAHYDIKKEIYGSGGLSCGWFPIWAEASGDNAHIRASAGARSLHVQCIDAAIVTGSAFDLGANCDLFGIRVDSSVHASATMTGNFFGINIAKSSGKLNWTTGIDINNSTTGIDIGACTDGINITGTCGGHALDTGAYGDVFIGNRTAGSGLSISTGGFASGLTVGVEYDAEGVANTTDYIGTAANFIYNHNVTCTSGGSVTSGMATIAAQYDIKKEIYGSGGLSAGWFVIWGEATGDNAHIRSSAGARALHMQAIDCAIATNAGFDLGTNCDLFGVRVDSSVHASATISGNFYGVNIAKSTGKKDWTIGLDVNDSTTGIDLGAATTGINISGAMTTGVNVAANLVIPQLVTVGTSADPIHWDGVAENWLAHTECTDTTTSSKTCYKFVLDAAHSAATTSGRLESLRAEVRSYSTNNVSGSIRALVGQVSFMDDCTYVGSGPQGCFGLVSSVWSGSNLTATGDVFSLGIFQGVETGSAYNGESAMIYCYQYGKTSVESLIRLDCNIGATSNMTYFLDCDGLDLASHHDFFSTDTCATSSSASDGSIKIRIGATVYEIPIFAE